MNWLFRRARRPLVQSSPEEWKQRWQSLVPPENRDVPITLDGQTVVAFVQVNQFVMMLQDGLLMESAFFDVCEFFQRAGYHVIWLMRCIQDVHNVRARPTAASSCAGSGASRRRISAAGARIICTRRFCCKSSSSRRGRCNRSRLRSCNG